LSGYFHLKPITVCLQVVTFARF